MPRVRLSAEELRRRVNEGKRAWAAKNLEKIRGYRRKHRAKNAKNIKASFRRFDLRVRYRLSESDYQAMWVSQGGKCAICDKELDGGRSTHVDHDHTTGVVRGILCRHCNAALGFARESEEILLAIIAYLARHKSAQAVAQLTLFEIPHSSPS